ncbi:MurR/RpiR family transcriptional regulator [Paenibacillus eucommiae]|uniref:DNA-binding MurR/RpiR family transcriptional regulator n=1 Tax=Paenibacillus eucommiae TaxID=1355755 RepID=A0ABS4J267_9BACL|nr:MurR/RpiR family transcriptional regulator [Paenibacillus eucommiae]MBP1993346.1 DNA-binding MurR/RpiR family transcriptional regulator [Paenibacillus eucommiae]
MKITEAGNTLLMIRSLVNAFTKTEQKVADYVLNHASEAIYLSITEMADRAGVGETTVLRFCRHIGFRGFQEFKLSLAQDVVQPVLSFDKEIQDDDDEMAISHKVVASHIRTLEETRDLLDPVKLYSAIELLDQAGKIAFYGVGSSGIIAEQAASTFMRIGKYCEAPRDTHFQAMSASLLTEHDVVVGMSVSGSTKDTIDNLTIARQSGAKIICITHNARSPITKISDIDLLMSARENPLQGSSLSAKIAQLIVIDILCMGLTMRMKETTRLTKEKTSRAVLTKFY